jgi:hypothetical protein
VPVLLDDAAILHDREPVPPRLVPIHCFIGRSVRQVARRSIQRLYAPRPGAASETRFPFNVSIQSPSTERS